jgi:hypothetical protein
MVSADPLESALVVAPIAVHLLACRASRQQDSGPAEVGQKRGANNLGPGPNQVLALLSCVVVSGAARPLFPLMAQHVIRRVLFIFRFIHSNPRDKSRRPITTSTEPLGPDSSVYASVDLMPCFLKRLAKCELLCPFLDPTR